MKPTLFIKKRMFKILWGASLCSLLFIGVSCQSDDDQPPVTNPLDGIWLSADKGYIIEFKEGSDVWYNISAAGCVLADDFNVSDFAISSFNPTATELALDSEQFLSPLTLTRLSDQNQACLPDQIANTADAQVNFDHFWNTFNDYYAFFDEKNVDWAQYESLRDQVTDANLYTTLEELVLLLEDGHVNVIDEAKGIFVNAGTPKLFERLNANLSGNLVIENEEDYDNLVDQKSNIVLEKYLQNTFESDPSGNLIWTLINNDIGYVNILGMAGFSDTPGDELTKLKEAVDRMMGDIKDAGITKLIIDVRINGGGLDRVSIEIASRFMDQQRTVFSKKARLGDSFTEQITYSLGPMGDFQFTGDIVLLTSPLTASAAEVFTLCMKDLPNVTIVGENTNGIFSDVLIHQLPNGGLISLSNEVYSDAQGIVYEGIGVGPSAENQAPLLSDSDFADQKDGGIDRAIEVLMK